MAGAAIEKVLMVDDEPHVRRVAELSLARVGGWTVTLAASGPEALAAAARERPDLILLDVMMPGMDGLSTLSALQASVALASIPVVFMTAKAQEREIRALPGARRRRRHPQALRSDGAAGSAPPHPRRRVPDGGVRGISPPRSPRSARSTRRSCRGSSASSAR